MQNTLSVFEHEKRPVVVWALIGTMTCASRSVQIWATSNLWGMEMLGWRAVPKIKAQLRQDEALLHLPQACILN